MKRNKRSGIIALFFLGSITVIIESCSFCPRSVDAICYFLDTTEVKQSNNSSQTLVFEDPGTIAVFNGSSCAESKKSGTQDIIKLKEAIKLPPYATKAAVFINGWHLKYLNGDEHIFGLASLIGDIQLENSASSPGKILTWQAGGTISDENFDNPYSWCYFYTVVAWNDTNLSLTIDQKDGTCDYRDHREANFYSADNGGTFTALTSYASFLYNPDFIQDKTVAILPRGFGFEWSGCHEDHHLLQIAYNLDHSEKFIERGKKYWKKFELVTPPAANSGSLTDSGFVSWETYAIFKDNDTRRDYLFGEAVSGLGGNDLDIIQPPFSILPKDGENLGTTNSNGVLTQNFTVRNIPFKYAIPMLTGWNLNYLTDDQHVKDIGIWIDDVHYFFDQNTQKGILNYKLHSVLADDDNWPDFYSRHKITILGLKGVSGIKNQKLADLIPYSPQGTEPASFCRIEDNGKLLRVTIKNQGNGDAGPSETKVSFNSSSFILETPAIPPGGTVDLLFKVPADCFSPDCSFTITVDSGNQVEETNEKNNSVNGGCIG